MTTNIFQPEEGFILKRFEELKPIANKYRDRGREFAKVTLPYLQPDTDGDTSSQEFQNDYNTEGAKLVNSLANTYAEQLFPAGRSFNKLTLKPEQYEEAAQDKEDIDAQFAAIERSFREHFATMNARPTLLDAMKHLIVTGNVLLHLTDTNKLVAYAIDEYVLLRGLDGEVLEIITEDKKSVWSLPADIQAQVISALQLEAKDDETLRETVSLYTYIRKNPDAENQWIVNQSVEGVNLPEENTYSAKEMRWIPVVWNRTRREMYGRGLVEEHFGSFWTLSILSEALALGAVTMADIKYLVKPGSLVDVQELNASGSGSFHYGEPEDVNAITSEKGRDMMFIREVIEGYKRHLGEVFMYLPSTMRDAERVTAEENRLRAVSLEKAHGGVYSSLAETMQRPLAELTYSIMGIMDQLEMGDITIEIVTGIDALSRGGENDRINHWLADLANFNSLPEDIRPMFDKEAFLKSTATGRDVDFTKFIITNEEAAKAAKSQAEMQAGLDAQVRQAGAAQAAPQQPQTF